MLSILGKNNPIFFILMGILACSVLFNLYGIKWGLPALWHPDEQDTIENIVIPMARNFDPNPHDFLKPSLYYYFLEVILFPYFIYYKIVGINSYTNFVSNATMIARIVSAIIGTLGVLLIYFLGKKYYNEKVGLISAFFLTCTMGFSAQTHFAYMDIPMVFLVLLMILLAFRYLETQKTSLLYWTSFVGGITISTKYNAALFVVVTFIICHLKRAVLSSPTPRSVHKMFIIIFSKSLVISLTFIVAGFILATPFSILDWRIFFDTVIKQLFITKGYKGFVGNYGWLENFSILKDAFGLPLFSLLLVAFLYGIITLIKKPTQKGAIIVLIPLLYYAYIGSWHISALRYVLPMIPFLVILGAGFIADFLKKGPILKLIAVIVLIVIGTYSYIYCFHGVKCFSNDTREIASQWIVKNIPRKSKLEVYSDSHYLPKFPESLSVDKVNPNFIVESPEYEQFKSRLKNSKLGRFFFKIFQQESQTLNIMDNRNDFSSVALTQRNPDYIVLTSFYYSRYLETSKNGYPYPELTKYFHDLIFENTHYEIIAKFENKTPNIEFVNPTVLIFKKKSS